MSIEKLSNRSIAGVAVCRAVGSAICGAAGVCEAVADALRDVSKASWMMEAHFGRRYEAATGTDLAVVVGEQRGSYSSDPEFDEATGEL